jgi:hypothetical protein
VVEEYDKILITMGVQNLEENVAVNDERAVRTARSGR